MAVLEIGRVAIVVMEALSRLLLSPAAARCVRVGASSTAGAGRALYAAVPIAAGEVFMNDEPIAFASRTTPSTTMRFSPALSALDEQLRRQSLNVPRLAMRCSVRVADELASSGVSPTWERLRHLARPQIEGQHEDVLSALHNAHPATRIFDSTRWHDLLGILHINTFRLEHGSAIFAGASMINHSCAPNTAYGEGNAFVAVLPLQEGEEVTVTYCDLDMPTPERKGFLSWNYGFDCTCPRCMQ